jgi:hypothetical protein
MVDSTGFLKRVTDRIDEGISKHKDGSMFKTSLEGTVEAEKIRAIAIQHGYDVAELSSTDGTVKKVLIGDIHKQPGSEDHLQYHDAITGIIKGLIDAGMIGKGDHYCFEAGIDGKVVYDKSQGTSIVMDSKGKEVRFELPAKDSTVQLMGTLKDKGIDSVCTDYVRFKGVYEKLARRAAALYQEGKIKEGDKTLADADGILIAKVQKGFATALKSMDEKAVQVCGTIDIFSGIIQTALKRKGDSYIVLMPKDPKY